MLKIAIIHWPASTFITNLLPKSVTLQNKEFFFVWKVTLQNKEVTELTLQLGTVVLLELKKFRFI